MGTTNSSRKRADRRKAEPPRPATENAPAEESAAASGPPSRMAPPTGFRSEPTYLALLEYFQNADWENCLLSLDHLLQAYPGEAELLAFKHDVEIRAELQRTSEQQRQTEDRLQRRKMVHRLLILGLSLLVVAILGYGLVTSYQAQQLREERAVQATQTAQALAARMSMADTLMRAGRAEEALSLYSEISNADPLYPDIQKDISAAQSAVTVEDLYQQGQQALANGDAVKALQLLQKVDALRPQYKDTEQLIAAIEQKQQVAALVTTIQSDSAQGDSAGVLTNYKAILAIDPAFNMPELNEVLFSSYRDLILKIADNPDPTLPEIQMAAEYYRNAMALFPQSLEHAREKAELQQIAVTLLASRGYLQGLALLESSDYSLQGLQQTASLLRQAKQAAPQSPALDAEIQKVQTFIDSYDSLVHGGWDKAISGLGSIYSRDENFAGGRVRCFLYEAYTARGDLLLASGDLGGAFQDYQGAEKAAFKDDSDVLRIFQIEVRVASVLKRMGQYEQSADFYHFAFTTVDYQARLTSPDQNALLQELEEADSVYNAGDKLKAAALYDATLVRTQQLYVLNKIDATQGDTLPNLACENGTTVWSLRNANDLGDNLILVRSQQLVVPVLPPVGKTSTP